MTKIKIDEKEYDISNPSEETLAQMQNLQFVIEEINQKNNEIQIAETAKIAYSKALKHELSKADS